MALAYRSLLRKPRLRTADTFTDDGLDIRFAVNTVAPYLLIQRLLPLLRPGARVVNLSSAAQSPVNLEALAGWKDCTSYRDGASQYQSLPARAGHSHSIINKPFLSFIFNGLFSC